MKDLGIERIPAPASVHPPAMLGIEQPGECYELAGGYVGLYFFRDEVDVTLVHGTAHLLPDVPLPFGHAWVLIAGAVYDPALGGFYDKAEYYEKLNAKEERTYTTEETRRRCCEEETWGPWHMTEGATK